MKKALSLIVLVVACSARLAAQGVPPVVTSHVNCPGGTRRYSQWYRQTHLADGKPYLATDQRKRQIVNNYHNLKLQMSADEVAGLLGRPDFGTARPPLHLATSPEPADQRCSIDVAYIVRKNSEDMIDKQDVAVYLSFSKDGKLYWAVPQNLPALKQLGSASDGK